ncbi:MAG TPA: beta-ketoacyl-ACP synthase III [Phycisphaerae bacterium]|nr:beta-ketoacyl-ACP synthase III [Phycisphaerae bacterium]
MPPFGARIAGTGSALPERRLTNADLEKLVDTSDEWIIQRTGMRERRIAGPADTTATLATAAARKALDEAHVDPRDLDLIIVATLTPDMMTPAASCLVQHNLGIKTHIGAFDLNAACSGFVYALATATQFIQNGSFQRILVVGAETLSRVVDYSDRNTCILFGDGAGAAVLVRDDNPRVGVQAFHLGANGDGAPLLNIPAGGSLHPASASTIAEKMHYLKMNGREVYKFAVHQMTESLRRAMESCHLTADDVKLVVPHQVNQRIIDSATEKMGFPKEKVFINIDRYGNTSAASVPIALDEARKSGRCGTGDWIITVAFGAGLTWAAATIKL